MKKAFLLFLIAAPLLVSGQWLIDHNRQEISYYWKSANASGKGIHATIKSSGTTIQVTEKTKAGQFQHRYELDSAGKCQLQQTASSCKDCLTERLNIMLADSSFHWKRLNENQYISRFEDHRMIELPAEGPLTHIRVIRMNWTQALYDLLKEPN